MKIPFKWELLDDTTWIAKVFGGWLIKSVSNGKALVFIPDSKHEWKV